MRLRMGERVAMAKPVFDPIQIENAIETSRGGGDQGTDAGSGTPRSCAADAELAQDNRQQPKFIENGRS
jgi:hypothetical protein